MYRIAIVQHAPVVLDREATLKKAVALIREADEDISLQVGRNPVFKNHWYNTRTTDPTP